MTDPSKKPKDSKDSKPYKPNNDEAWVLLSFLFNKVKNEENENKSVWSVVYPPTQKLFSENDANKLIQLLSGGLKNDLEKFEKSERDAQEKVNSFQELPTYEDKRSHIPMYETAVHPEDSAKTQKNEEALRKRFQDVVRNFLRAQKNPAAQLAFLNKIQKQTKFHLFNTHNVGRSKGSSTMQSLKYGYADLLRFLCEPVKSGQVAKFTKSDPLGHRYVVLKKDEASEYTGKKYVKNHDGTYTEESPNTTDGRTRYRKEATTNPFYNPIQYDVPDQRSNELLEKLYVGARQYYAKKISELAYLKKKLKEKPSKERRKSILENMLLIFRQIHDNRFDPIHLSKQIKGQERPMETYRNEHFYELLEQLSTRKRLHPASVGERPPNGNTGISLNNPTLALVVEKKSTHTKRRKSRKH